MSDLKSLHDVLGHDDSKEELYTSDQKKRSWRSQKGQYSRNKGIFNFLQLIKDWESIVGKMMAENTVPLKIKSKTLFINTKHAIFAQELGFLAPEILKKIKAQFPELSDKLEKIKFSHSSYSAQTFNQQVKKAQIKSPTAKTKKNTLHPYSPAYKIKRQKADEYFRHIDDPEVKQMLIDFMISYE